VLVRDMVNKLAEDLKLERDLANDVLLEILVELGKKAFLERVRKGYGSEEASNQSALYSFFSVLSILAMPVTGRQGNISRLNLTH